MTVFKEMADVVSNHSMSAFKLEYEKVKDILKEWKSGQSSAKERHDKHDKVDLKIQSSGDRVTV